MKQTSPIIITHGGAYDIPLETHQAHMDGSRQAAEIGWTILTRGGSALEAVEAAVRALEDDPTFDAGYGSFLNAAAEVELDAIIMDGRDLNFGAVAAVQRVRHPVTLARLVMTESEHALLAGAGAEAFARQMDVPVCPVEELLAERELARWRTAQAEGKLHDLEPFGVDSDGAPPSEKRRHSDGAPPSLQRRHSDGAPPPPQRRHSDGAPVSLDLRVRDGLNWYIIVRIVPRCNLAHSPQLREFVI